jgi:hypothetical protein
VDPVSSDTWMPGPLSGRLPVCTTTGLALANRTLPFWENKKVD